MYEFVSDSFDIFWAIQSEGQRLLGLAHGGEFKDPSPRKERSASPILLLRKLEHRVEEGYLRFEIPTPFQPCRSQSLLDVVLRALLFVLADIGAHAIRSETLP